MLVTKNNRSMYNMPNLFVVTTPEAKYFARERGMNAKKHGKIFTTRDIL